MKSWTLQDTVRLGMTILMAVYVLDLVSECRASNADYSIVHDHNNGPKPRSKPREIRGFKPQIMSTALGFGKRQSNSFHSSKLGREALGSPGRDFSERFPVEWLGQFFKMHPEIARKFAKNLLADEEKLGPSVVQRYKKHKNDEAYYYED
ncbi:uncharacterized protein [Venturia canescens]|uniref:uncharacterized protein n=1 Tax=Venturia canescens TaxID=32260 RepID=UPI001C9C3E4C|nr:uncharacterized protein LOC122409552 [Venturia canescens]